MKYYIPKCNLQKLEKLINRLSKKTNVEFTYDMNDIKQAFISIDGGITRYFYNQIGVEINIDYKVGDYDIVAEIEHHQEGNIIRNINLSYQVPNQFRTCKPYCDHCNKLRNRNNTFLLIDKSNNIRQVGKSCLKDFIGYDNEKIIEMVNSLNLFLNSYDEEDIIEDSKKCRFEELKYMANKFYQLVLKNGYKKDNDKIFDGLEKIDYNKDLEPKIDEILNVVNSKWYDDNSDYCHNVKVVLSLEYIEVKHWKLLLSYINSALKYLQELEGINNTYLGNIKDKIEFEVKSFKLLYTRETYYSYYGETSYVYRIITKTNNIIIWNTGSKLDDDVKVIKATIKDLKEYKGEKQTIITRGQIIKEEKPVKYEETAEYGFKQLDEFLELN